MYGIPTACSHLAVTPQQPMDAPATAKVQPPSEDPLFDWNDADWCAKLSQECSICPCQCEPGDMVAHLHDHHNDLTPSILTRVNARLSPTPYCCSHCWKAPEVVDRCPLTWNLAAFLASHATLRDHTRRPDGTTDGHLRRPAGRPSSSASSQAATRSRQHQEIPPTNFQRWSSCWLRWH